MLCSIIKLNVPWIVTYSMEHSPSEFNRYKAAHETLPSYTEPKKPITGPYP
jgi:hypothetical protein